MEVFWFHHIYKNVGQERKNPARIHDSGLTLIENILKVNQVNVNGRHI